MKILGNIVHVRSVEILLSYNLSVPRSKVEAWSIGVGRNLCC